MHTHTRTRSYTIAHLLLRLLIFSSSFCPILNAPPPNISVFNHSCGFWWDIDAAVSRRWSLFRHRRDLLHNVCRPYYTCMLQITRLSYCYGCDDLLLRRSPSRVFSMKVAFRLWLWLSLSTLCINSCHEFALGLDQGVLGAGRGERGGKPSGWSHSTTLLSFNPFLHFLRICPIFNAF